MPFHHFTDDTVLCSQFTIAVADNLIHVHVHERPYYYDETIRYFGRQNTPLLDTAVEHSGKWINDETMGVYHSWGNGSPAMICVSPCA